ncbi:MAG: COQ9 family protein [Pseudomonadota bacterium]
MERPSHTLKDRWLEALLPIADERGWSEANAKSAASQAGLSEGECALAAPGGVNDLIDHMFQRAADKMLEEMAARDLSELRTHERVAEGLKLWLAQLDPYRQAVKKAAVCGVFPTRAGAASRTVWAIADAVWEAAGDTATDYNRQTKRGLLSAVIPSVVMFWVDRPNEADLDAHIEKRLGQAMRLGQAGSKVVKPVLDLFAQVRDRTVQGS